MTHLADGLSLRAGEFGFKKDVKFPSVAQA